MTLYLDPSELKHELAPALATIFFEPGSSKLKANPDHNVPMLNSTAQHNPNREIVKVIFSE